MLDPARDNGPLLVVLTGPSGVGKDSVLDRLQELGHDFFRVVTVTTRPQREGERPGVDYRFISQPEYDEMVRAGELLEYAGVYGKSYGTPRAPVSDAIEAGRDVILRVDVQGAATIREKVPGAVCIFIAPPSLDELEQRLRDRKTETPEGLARRLATVHAEMERVSESEYVVVNHEGCLDDTVAVVRAIMTAERARIRRPRVVV